MKEQDFRVGQKVRISDVREGVVTDILDTGFIHLGGYGWVSIDPPSTSRTITVLSEPKPDEPTMLGSVVLDKDGDVWIGERHMDGRHLWRNASTGMWRTWSHVDAVEVLFPGVPEEKP